MSNVDRRDFLKLVGAGGVGVGAGFMLAESIKHPVEHLVPYPVPPEEFSPGIATWYNSVCGMCSAGCGITVRTREGRAKKIEGNPSHPVSQGKLCALGQAGLQVLYNPDRVTGAMMSSGDRGSGSYVQTTWDEALGFVAERLGALQGVRGNRICLLSDGVRGHLALLQERFMAQLGSSRLLRYEFDDHGQLYTAMRTFFGEARLPYYDIENATYTLSFGADYLNNWLSPVHMSLGFGRSRHGAAHRGYFVQFESRLSLSGAAADEWVAIRPGTDGILALGIARLLLADGVYGGDDRDAWTAALADYTTRNVSARCGVPEATIRLLADGFAAADAALAIGGGAAAHHSNGAETLTAINALNYLAGNIGRPGGLIFNPEPPVASAAPARRAGFDAMMELAEAARRGDIEVLIVGDTNPVFTLPAAADFADALANVPLIVSVGSFMNETSALADVILPSHTYLESWGDDTPEPGVGFAVAAVSQPVVAPLYDTRNTGDILLALAARLGHGEAMPWTGMEAYLKEAYAGMHAGAGGDPAEFDRFWRDILKAGVWGQNARREHAFQPDPAAVAGIAVDDPVFAGDADDYPFHLQPYLSTSLNDGRGANLPWMQELPDPMTSVVYGTWVEMNPSTAGRLGLKDGDVVEVESGHGTVAAPVLLYPGIAADVVAMPIGQGHGSYGRYASGRGANPLAILAPAVDAASGSHAWGATRVRLATTGRRANIVRTGGESRQLGRNIVRSTGGDHAGSAGHTASLSGIPIKVEPA